HAAGADEMRSRLRLGDTHGGVPLERGVVVPAPLCVKNPAVSMIVDLVKAQVRHEYRRVGEFAAQPTDGEIEDAVGRVGTPAAPPLPPGPARTPEARPHTSASLV